MIDEVDVNLDTQSTTYAWYLASPNFKSESGKYYPKQEEIFCAWCHRSKKEIAQTEDPADHVKKHEADDQLPIG